MTKGNDGPRTALVTGATGNLGRTVVQRLEAGGTRVAQVERNLVRWEGDPITEIDLENGASVDEAFARVTARTGPLDAVIHTVGIYRGGRSLQQTQTADFADLFSTNVLTTMHVLRAALVHMLPRKQGHIAVVASLDALQAVAGQSAYGASKAAQLRMLEAVAAEIRGTGVTVNAVLPSTMDTPQNRAAMPDADPSRWVSLDSVADVLIFLASPAARAIHGQALRVGG